MSEATTTSTAEINAALYHTSPEARESLRTFGIVSGVLVGLAVLAVSSYWVYRCCIQPRRSGPTPRVAAPLPQAILAGPRLPPLPPPVLEDPPRYSDVVEGYEWFELQHNPQHRTGHTRQESEVN